jgi:hypothetical protein
MWDESTEYQLNGTTTRKVFETPSSLFVDPKTGMYQSSSGTQDLEWCKRVIEGKYLEKAGWGKFAKSHPVYPFLCDTSIFTRHITTDGIQFPLEIPKKFLKK